MSINLEELQCLRKKQGVYFLYDEDKQLVYIGESGNMYQRILEHIVESKKIFSHFKAIEIDNKTSSQLMEIKLICELKPKYNNLVIPNYDCFFYALPTIAKNDYDDKLFDHTFQDILSGGFGSSRLNLLYLNDRQRRVDNFKRDK